MKKYKEKEAIELLESFEPDDLVECAMYRNALETVLNLIEKQQKEIDKQNKVIDEMTKYMEDRRECGQAEEFCNKKDCYADEYINGYCPKCLNCIKQYFIRKVEEDE